MIEFLLFIMLMGVLILPFMLIIFIIAEEWKNLSIVAAILLICVFTWSYFLKTDEQTAINKQDVIVAYGVVTSLSDKSIEVDGHETNIGNIVNEKYKIDYKKLAVGDVVEMKFLKSVLKNYLITIDKIK